jgi:aspartyl-tRNA(Asn)/glutamyl-tRNA(Gln) amidotransferase subunit C
MALTEKDVLYVADLAHLELSGDEVAKFVPQLNSILEYMQKLNHLDTTNVEPMAQVAVSTVENSALRADRAQRILAPEGALQSAPDSGGGCFKVPRVIDRG